MELLLEKIARNKKPKTSLVIMVSDKSTHIRTKFNPLIQLDKTKKYEMGLVGSDTYYSFPNIDSTNNNFRYSPDNGSTWFNINISEGSYEITNINNYIQRIMKQNGHYDSVNEEYYITIKANSNTLKSILDIGSNYKVDFTTANSVSTVLGFNKQIYSEGYNESDNIVNILSVTTIRITSDIIEIHKWRYEEYYLLIVSESRSGLQNNTRAVETYLSSDYIKHNFSHGNQT